MARRASLNEQKPQSGFFGSMWHKYVSPTIYLSTLHLLRLSIFSHLSSPSTTLPFPPFDIKHLIFLHVHTRCSHLLIV
ncbi:hypothetical protein F5B17DRAFT_403524, partial [Nemania serpens]